MGKPFPTKKEQAAAYRRWAAGLTAATFALWLGTYIGGMIPVYGFICPLLYLAAVRCSFRAVRLEKGVFDYLLLILSGGLFLLSLAPWIFPVAR